jgi:hypothetical protein
MLDVAVTAHAEWTLYGKTLDHHEETQLWRYVQQYETIDLRQSKVSYISNQSNTHDHQKHKHSSYHDCERLKVYYNREIDGWFVGRGLAC